ncbi:MAG: carboxymuconolactone decarboxylase family protein [Actinomycetota bacterium]|nr:carboxymuconolactone decarboxylase family protein [Actinomycetota bacterium]
MARIEQAAGFADIPTAELGEGDRVNLGVAGIMSRLPDVAAAVGGVTGALNSAGVLPRRLMELVRLRIAFHNQCRSCMSIRYQSAIDDGLTEDAVCALESPSDAADLTDAERAALRFADLFATDHLAIDDAVYDELRGHFSEDALVALGLHCALCVGLGRLAATWHVVDDVPEEFRRDGGALPAPWAGGSYVASG